MSTDDDVERAMINDKIKLIFNCVCSGAFKFSRIRDASIASVASNGIAKSDYECFDFTINSSTAATYNSTANNRSIVIGSLCAHRHLVTAWISHRVECRRSWRSRRIGWECELYYAAVKRSLTFGADLTQYYCVLESLGLSQVDTNNKQNIWWYEPMARTFVPFHWGKGELSQWQHRSNITSDSVSDNAFLLREMFHNFESNLQIGNCITLSWLLGRWRSGFGESVSVCLRKQFTNCTAICVSPTWTSSELHPFGAVKCKFRCVFCVIFCLPFDQSLSTKFFIFSRKMMPVCWTYLHWRKWLQMTLLRITRHCSLSLTLALRCAATSTIFNAYKNCVDRIQFGCIAVGILWPHLPSFKEHFSITTINRSVRSVIRCHWRSAVGWRCQICR